MKLLALFLLSLSFASCGSSGGGSASALVPPPVVVPPNTFHIESKQFITQSYESFVHTGVFEYARSSVFEQEIVTEKTHDNKVVSFKMFITVSVWHEQFNRVEIKWINGGWSGESRGFIFIYSIAGFHQNGSISYGGLNVYRAPADTYESVTYPLAANG